METTVNLTLSYSDKRDLRQLYAHYKSLKMQENGFALFDTKEELYKARQEAILEFETKYPLLKEANISFNKLPELIYSENQLQFIEDAEQTGFDIEYSYSGRGMFGDFCPAIKCESHNDITTTAKTTIDSLGKRIVIYAQN